MELCKVSAQALFATIKRKEITKNKENLKIGYELPYNLRGSWNIGKISHLGDDTTKCPVIPLSGVLRQNERLCMVWVPELGFVQKNIQSVFLLFATSLETVKYLDDK